jgi:3-hydroxyisobutyrate dehydrogenase-like beta-hydroxyacid dehydrogenase
MAATTQRVGFVGVGRMGANMARHLRDDGYTLSAVYDVRREEAESVASELECQASENLAAVTASSDTIITVVTDDDDMRQIFSESGDSLLTEAGGKIFVNCATVTPNIHVEVEALAEKAGAESLEACMASSITQARDGTLYLMCAGREAVYRRMEPLLESLSTSRLYIGPAGAAAQVKALVNMVMNVNTAGLAEGLGLGAALGLDLEMLQKVFSQTGANSRVLETDGEDMINRDHETYFSAAHAAKDSGIALGLARDAGLDLPLAEATKSRYDEMVAIGKGGLDKSGIAELTFPGRR